jgi:hypothetical protein
MEIYISGTGYIRHYVKVPSQELSDLLIKELDKKSKKK